MTAFVMLPFGIQTHDEAGIPKVRGQADSAPANFRPGRLVFRATIVSVVLTVLYVMNYTYGWIGADTMNLFERMFAEPG